MAANGQLASTLAVRPIDTGSSFRTLAYARLREAIAAADIYGRPDEIRLDERQLAAALGVSRTPIREAMTLLERRASCARCRAAASSSCARPSARSSR